MTWSVAFRWVIWLTLVARYNVSPWTTTGFGKSC